MEYCIVLAYYYEDFLAVTFLIAVFYLCWKAYLDEKKIWDNLTPAEREAEDDLPAPW